MTEWIDVKERLPESTTKHEILIFIQKQGCKPYISMGYYWNNKFLNDGMCLENETTHWMPLPEPPRTPKERGGEK